VSTRGWAVKTTDNPFTYRAEREGFVITATEPNKFTLTTPEEVIACEDIGTAFEAHRLGDAMIRRLAL
jgi:hypothetical protein